MAGFEHGARRLACLVAVPVPVLCVVGLASVTGHTLKVVEHVEFTDGSARPNYTQVETFTR